MVNLKIKDSATNIIYASVDTIVVSHQGFGFGLVGKANEKQATKMPRQNSAIIKR